MLTRGFSALRVRNFRLWFAGQMVSVSGNWMQTTALGWLVVQITGDGLALGTVMALQYLPLLVLGPLGGSLVDRGDARRAVLLAQSSMGALALVLWLLAVLDLADMPALYLIALLLGVAGLLDNPARRAFISEIVPGEYLGSAISLSGVMVNTSRVIGPAIAAIVIAVAGVAPCFLINGLSFAVVVGSLLAMRRSELIPRPPRAAGPVRIVDTLHYVARVPALRRPLASMAIVGTFTFEFAVVLPLLASRTFGGDGSTYGVFLSVLSVGAILGSLAAGAVADASARWLEASLLATAVTVVACALAPTLPLELATLFFAGMASFGYVTVASTGVQVHAGAEHRGRVLALWSMAFLGSTMVGAPIVGWVSTAFGPRAGLVIGAAAALVAAGLVIVDRGIGSRRPGQPSVAVG